MPVAYYRTRPSEPEASAVALRLQREAVKKFVEQEHLTVHCEFVEEESEDNNSYPVYIAAYEYVKTHSEEEGGGTLLVASRAGIGSGEPQRVPSFDGFPQFYITDLNADITEIPREIPVPKACPYDAALFAKYDLRNLNTNVYLCNATNLTWQDVRLSVDCISMSQY